MYNVLKSRNNPIFMHELVLFFGGNHRLGIWLQQKSEYFVYIIILVESLKFGKSSPFYGLEVTTGPQVKPIFSPSTS